jgi:hypothetical protein
MVYLKSGNQKEGQNILPTALQKDPTLLKRESSWRASDAPL